MAKNYSLDELRLAALSRDVSYDITRLFREQLDASDPDVLHTLRMGYLTSAIVWLESTSEERMQFGDDSKNERLGKAASFATLADIPLDVIAETHSLTHLL